MVATREEQNIWKEAAGKAAAQLIQEGMIVGLGTGSTADAFIRALGQRIQEGLKIQGAVSSSQTSLELAKSFNIPCSTLDTFPSIDIYIDGADEIDPQLQLIKGAGGALVREKIVASAAFEFVVIADATKLVRQLGHTYPVPVEVIPFAQAPVQKQLEALGAQVKVRQTENTPFITENHNVILDCTFQEGIVDATALDAQIHRIVGVVETGLFLGMARRAIIGGPSGVETMTPETGF